MSYVLFQDALLRQACSVGEWRSITAIELTNARILALYTSENIDLNDIPQNHLQHYSNNERHTPLLARQTRQITPQASSKTHNIHSDVLCSLSTGMTSAKKPPTFSEPSKLDLRGAFSMDKSKLVCPTLLTT